METKKDTKVKILVACHMPCRLLQDDVFVPIHVGRAVAESCSKDRTITQEELDWMKENMIGDNEGDNISEQNRYLNELTAIYWAWKNYERLGNPDYIGFMHHRRHLCFDLKNKEIPDRYGLLYSEKLDEKYIEKYCLKAENVTSVVSHYDIVVAERCDLKRLGTKNCYNHYLTADTNSLHIEDYDKVLKILIEKHPDYKESVDKYNASRYAYFTNIFIMKRAIFMAYAEWLFPIIFEAQKSIDTDRYNISEARTNAYISEWLFGIWYTHLKKEKNIKSLELKRTFVRDTSIHVQRQISPAFTTNNIAICLAVDEQYILYLGVAIQSIIQNAKNENNYDILILHEQLSIDAQKRISEMQKSNVSVRFVSVEQCYEDYGNIFYKDRHLSRTTYNRFFIASLCKNYSKILYLDCDLVANRDVADLFNTPLGEQYLIAAVRDFEANRMYASDRKWGKSYYNDFLNLKGVSDYFQAGVLLFNVAQFQREDILKKLVSTLIRLKNPSFHDQDVLNVVCENRVLFLDPRWNVEYHIPIWTPNWKEVLPVGMLNDYIASREDPWIIHFSGAKKPWQDPSLDMSTYFWKYARLTPFYEEILMNMSGYHLDVAGSSSNMPPGTGGIGSTLKSQFRMLYELAMLPTYQRKLKRIRFRLHLSWGARRQRYLQRKQKLKEKIKAIEKMIKDFRRNG